MKTDLATSYAATVSRIGSWAVVSALVYRAAGPDAFARLTVARSGALLINYISLGLTPIVLQRLARELQAAAPIAVAAPPLAGGTPTLSYQAPGHLQHVPAAQTFLAGGILVWIAGAAMLAVAMGVQAGMGGGVKGLAVGALMCLAMAFRCGGDVAGARLQAGGGLAIDNLIVSLCEWSWPGFVLGWEIVLRPPGSNMAESAAAAFLLASALMMVFRALAAQSVVPLPRARLEGAWGVIRTLLSPAGLLALGHLADFCYAPANQLLLGRYRAAEAVAAYAPGVQVDAALLLLTAAIPATVLPRAARALAAGDVAFARRLYLRGTLASGALTLAAGAVVWTLARPILQAWLGPSMPAAAPWLLRLILIHTLLGCPAGMSRAVLLAAGQSGRYAAAALLAGAANVLAATLLLRLTSAGPAAVVAVTILTGAARCLIWLPWQTWQVLGDFPGRGPAAIIPAAAGPQG